MQAMEPSTRIRGGPIFPLLGVLIVETRPLHFSGKQGIMAMTRWFPLCTVNYDCLTHEQSSFLGILSGWVSTFLLLALLGIAGPHRGCVPRRDGGNLDFSPQ